MGAAFSTRVHKAEKRTQAVVERTLDSRTFQKVRSWLESAGLPESSLTGPSLDAKPPSGRSKSFAKVQSEGSSTSCYFGQLFAQDEDEASIASPGRAIKAYVQPLDAPSGPLKEARDEAADRLVERLPDSQAPEQLAKNKSAIFADFQQLPAPIKIPNTGAASRRGEADMDKQTPSSRSCGAPESGVRHFRGDSCFDGDRSPKRRPGHARKISHASSVTASPRKVARPLHRCCSHPSITAASLLASPEFARKEKRTLGQKLQKSVRSGLAAVGSCLKVMCLAPSADKISDINSLDGCITRADVLEAERLTNGNRKLKRRLLKQLRKARMAAAAAQSASGLRSAV